MVSVRKSDTNSRISVKSTKETNAFAIKDNLSEYYAKQAEHWAHSEEIVNGIDYSSKYYANKSKGYAQNAENFEAAARETYNNLIVKSENAITDIETAKADAVGNITTARDESIASVEAKSNEVLSTVNTGIAEINTTKTNAVNAVNNTKTTILQDIEFVADGEKEEIRELADYIKDNAEDIANRTSFAMFDTVIKDHVLTYEESKGLALQGTYVYKDAIAGSRYGYPDFYNKCLEEYNEATATETVNGVTVKVHSNGHKFYDIANKSAIDGFFNTMGSAWFYGVDTAEERIFLPRNNFFEQMTANVAEVGDSVQAGLPNITGQTALKHGSRVPGFDSFSGAIQAYNIARGGDSNAYVGNQTPFGFNIDASRSSAIYGRSSTVQPNAVKKLLYICVGNTVADTSWVDVVTQVEGGVKDLEDKTNEGLEALANASNALRETQITNCLLEVPQRIKLELNNGTLTLKAGSEVIVPNGFEADGTTPKFDELVIENDVSITFENAYVYDPIMIALKYDGSKPTFFKHIGTCLSGTTPVQYSYYYRTDLNKMYDYETDTSTPYEQLSFPLGLFKWDGSNGITEIKQVFNGMGYIGSTIWVDKGVKGLIPNGRNEDGSLRNVERLIPNIITRTWSNDTATGILVSSSDTYMDVTTTSLWIYDEQRNIWIYTNSGSQGMILPLVDVTLTAGKITSFQPKQPFRAVDYSDYVNTPHIVETYQNGYSWYRVWSDGWCEQGGYSNPNTTVSLLKSYTHTHYYVDFMPAAMDSATMNGNFYINNKTTSSFKVIGSWGCVWKASGYMA